MSQNKLIAANFAQHILYKVKKCFVLLKPLDKKILEQYVKQYEVNLTTNSVSSCTEDKNEKRKESRTVIAESSSKNEKKRKHPKELIRQNLQKSTLTDDFDRLLKKRKLKVEPLHTEDDANQLKHGNFKENIPNGTELSTKNTKQSPTLNAGNADLDEKRKSQILQNHSNSGLSENDCAKSLEQNSLLKNEFGSNNEKREKEPKRELFSRTSLGNSFQKTSNKEKHFNSEDQQSKKFSQSEKTNFNIKLMMNNENNNNNKDLAVKSEVKTIEEYAETNICQMKSNCGHSGAHFIKNEVKSAVIVSQEFEEEEYDPRDESEDDTATIIFDGSLDHQMTNVAELSKKSEKKNPRVIKKLQKKKMINCKKQTFLKFKRKRSMLGKNLSKVQKAGKKNLGAWSQKQQSTKKPNEIANESNITEVCHLVKRLHELYRIIMQLQEDLPKNSEIADHFIKTINVQQENFLQEIKKSQKIIIRGYEKMLNFYGNTKKVCKEIGKRTCLSKEEVIRVISRFNFVGETCEEVKITKEIEKKEPHISCQEKSSGQSDSPNKIFNDEILTLPEMIVVEKNDTRPVVSENTTKENPKHTSVQNRANNNLDSVSRKMSLPFSSTGARKTLLPTPVFEPQMTRDILTRESNFTTHLPSQQFYRVDLPLIVNNQEQWVDYSKPRPNFWLQKNYNLKTQAMMKNSRTKRSPQNLTHTNPYELQHISHIRIPPRPIHSQPLNIRAQYHGDGFFTNSARPRVASNYSPNSPSGYFQVLGPSGRNMSQSIPALMDINPNFTEYSRARLPINHYPQILNSSSSTPTSNGLLRVIQSLENPGHNDLFLNSRSTKSTNCRVKVPTNSRRRCQPSSSQRFELSVPRIPNQENFPSEIILTNNTKFLQSNSDATQSKPVSEVLPNSTEMNMNIYNFTQKETNDKSSEEYKRCFLDPTVPQKLTMKNCRLQAGPLIEVKTKRIKLEDSETKTWDQIVPEETLSKSDIKVEKFDQEETNSRVYMCAQNGCKNSGVRICKGCMSVIYCSESCQLNHWTQKHKTECHQLKELRG